MAALLYPCVSFAENCEKRVATVVSVQGSVEVQRAGETQWQTVKLNDTFCPGDKIRVNERSRAGLTLVNQPVLRLDQNTSITLGGVKEKQTSVVELARGALHFFSRVRRNLEVLTGFVNAGVEGTEGFISVEKDRTFISIFDGQVLASNAVGSLTLTSGQSAVAEAGKAPVLRVVVRPRDAVHWALYYLPVLYVPPGESPKEDLGDPGFLTYRASRLLAVGRVNAAKADIQRALSLNPMYSDAYALQATIFVVQNEREKALGSAKKAVETGPNSATAHIATSYARQADFDLEGARASVEEAVRLDPNNALAWARLAELWSSLGRLGRALDAAKKAVDLDPNLSRTQMVLGFAYLTQVKTTESRAAFEKAIELDQADPLSRLGLGLAKIRGGDLQAGGREVEIAASLDPNNSIFRSYLGKAYFDKKQNKLSRDQFAIAKELDPLDPTPWFYDAIRKQTINRPVEALQDMQRSIELNDNRAVYRSRLLLDEDLAARSASLGRIYNDLGFQQLGLVEGWKSVNTAPANYSAHRLLADLYAALPRHEIARTSELFQSQLLQPLNITPVQPELAVSNLFILEGAGPADPSFNEFNQLFLRNRLALQASGVIGNNDTWGNNIAQSGVWNNISYSLGQFHYETDGFRDNNDQDLDLYNAFVQVRLTPKTSILGEYRYSDTETGDLELTFTDSFVPTLREEETIKELRFGLRHTFTPRSNLLASFIYQDAELDTVVFPGFFEIEGDFDVYVGEIRYIYQSERFNITGGGGYRHQDETEKDLGFPDVNTDTKFTNAYAYAQIALNQSLSVTLGASGDFLEAGESGEDRDQFNPKLGLIWKPNPSTTLRAAVFRTLEKPRASQRNIDPTLEPTQVAGFNQFFLGAEGDREWRYGIAFDQKFPHNIYGGAEFSARDIDAQLIDETGLEPVIIRRDWDEYQVRAYLNWTPFEQLALSTEYLFEKFKREENGGFLGAEEFKELHTHRVPIEARYFHPSGFSGGVKATYVYQDGDFLVDDGFGSFTIDQGDDQFWILDAAISYRLPKRYGLISLEAKNLLDNDFQFQDTDPGNPQILPERFILLTATLSF
jgi:tetratricopeptide (TPR) repeat protein